MILLLSISKHFYIISSIILTILPDIESLIVQQISSTSRRTSRTVLVTMSLASINKNDNDNESTTKVSKTTTKITTTKIITDPIERRKLAQKYVQYGMNTIIQCSLLLIPTTGTTSTDKQQQQLDTSTSSTSTTENEINKTKQVIEKSIQYFNMAEQYDTNITPYLWQRGLSYYYASLYNEASIQFQLDVSVNPYDTEEIVWDIASQCQSFKVVDNTKFKFPLSTAMSLPNTNKDRRRIMPYVYRLFRGEIKEEELFRAGQTGSLADEFYSLFYLGLFCESCYNNTNEQTKSNHYIRQAISTQYAISSNDYMTSIARLHYKIRGL